MSSIRLRPTNPIAPEAILVGDPGRALSLAQALLVEPKMSNHARGLWGYTSATGDGSLLTIQSTGMGGPSAAAVLADLAALGVRRAVRVGTCRSLGPVRPGEPTAITAARSLDGPVPQGQPPRVEAGDGPGAGEIRPPGIGLTAALCDAVGRETEVLCLYEDPARAPAGLLADRRSREAPDCGVTDMQTAALFASGLRLGLEIGAVLVPEWSDRGERLEPEQLEQAVDEAARAAIQALGSEPKSNVEV